MQKYSDTIALLVANDDFPAILSEVKKYRKEGGDLGQLVDSLHTALGGEEHLRFCFLLAAFWGKEYNFNALLKAAKLDFAVAYFMNFYANDREFFMEPQWADMNKRLFLASLRHLGINNYENSHISGEEHLLRTLMKKEPAPVVFDVGGNVGGYIRLARSFSSTARIYSFEPHPGNFAGLCAVAEELGAHAFNFGLSDREMQTTLYDRADSPKGSAHASLYLKVVTDLHGQESTAVACSLRTLDAVMAELDVSHIHLLKVDTEGHELAVLRGGVEAIAQGKVDYIHFEFNEMNVLSKTFLRDFMEFLPQYSFYRLLPEGFLPLPGHEHSVMREQFIYQNILAVRDDFTFRADCCDAYADAGGGD